jgi:nucleotide-binding universal stress UspA family protein
VNSSDFALRATTGQDGGHAGAKFQRSRWPQSSQPNRRKNDEKGEKGENTMYKKIMVPLDGSELAECVLPHVEAFIEGCHVNHFVFVRVVEPAATFYSGDYPISPEVMKERETAGEKIAREYLDQVVSRLEHTSAELYSEVLIGNVADSLADYSENNDFDLILIATHGRSGVNRWVRGSIADKVLRSSHIPVLMVRAPGSEGGI